MQRSRLKGEAFKPVKLLIALDRSAFDALLVQLQG